MSVAGATCGVGGPAVTIGTLGASRQARVDALGTVTPDVAGWSLEWWIGADDRWRVLAHEVAVRQTLVDDMPVVRTAMRVPGGDAIQRAYGVTGLGSGAGGLVVVEVENASPAPFVAAFVVHGARRLQVAGTTAVVDGRPSLVTARPASRWACTRDGTTLREVATGNARSGPFPATTDRAGRLAAAFLHPVPHRSRVRAVVPLGAGAPGPIDVAALPDADAVARGWVAQLDRGLRTELPDDAMARAVRIARAGALLDARRRVDGALIAALEDWGFDDEARDAWARASGRARRRAARRPSTPATWRAVERALTTGRTELLLALRTLLVDDRDDDRLTLLAELPDTWRGGSIDVRDAPTRRGSVSYAVRWHGERPALFWEAPTGVRLDAPGLDPDWTTDQASGEALLPSGVT